MKAEELMILGVGKVEVAVATAVAGLVIYYVFFRKKQSNPGFSPSQLDDLLKRSNTGSNSKAAPAVKDANFLAKMKRTGKNIAIFFGSQTGTAEEFSVRIAKGAQKYAMKGLTCDPEDVDDWELLKDINEEVDRGFAIFCMATYGEGEPTDNAVEFYNWLKETDVDLSGLKYAVFGLGNRTYEHFNSMGIFVDEKLEKLGAERMCKLGLGDDDQNIEDDFVQWLDAELWPSICKNYDVEGTGEFSSVRQYEVEEYEDIPDRLFVGEPARYQSFQRQRPPYEAKNPFLASITTERKLNTNEDRYFMHIELDLTDSRMRYDAGDHIAVLPINQPSLIEKLGTLLDINLDKVFSLNNVDPDDTKKHPFPCPTTYRTAFSYYLDIMSNPTTHLCRELAEYANDESEKTFLTEMASNTPEGKAKYMQWIKHDNRNIVSVLEDLKSLKMPADHLCELLPRLNVRYYSISSSAKMNPTSVHITAVLVDYVTPTGRHNKGVCTQYLLDKSAESVEEIKKVACYVRKSQFRLPMKTSVPVIMIGPGLVLRPSEASSKRNNGKRSKANLSEKSLYFMAAGKKAKTSFIVKKSWAGWRAELYLTCSRHSAGTKGTRCMSNIA